MKRVALVLVAATAFGAWAGASGARASTVWLCRPGLKPNPCTESLDFTAVRADNSARVYRVGAKTRQPIDCFYVYPTVNLERTGNSDLVPGVEERDTARDQASWFSPVCRVFAPMYRQVTALGNSKPSLHADRDKAYADVRDAWNDYLAHWNHGRGVVLIGHSQGASHLKRLLREEIEVAPATRKLLVSALLLGGDVLVGEDGDFRQVPPCASKTQIGCVVAYSSWGRTPPVDAGFMGVGNAPTQRVLCVNPAAPGGGTAAITPMFLAGNLEDMGGMLLLTNLQTDWISFPGLYRAHCVRRGARAWLQIDAISTRGDRRPKVREQSGPGSGLHEIDVNIALFDLVGLVAGQASAYVSHR